jgi:hypothetical protein
MSLADAQRLSLAYRRDYSALLERVDAAVVRAWRALANVDGDAAERFAAAAAALVAGFQAQAANLAALFVVFQIAALLDAPPGSPPRIPPGELTDEALRGVPGLEVYRRPVVAARSALARGEPWSAAMAAGEAAAAGYGRTDVALAQRHAARTVLDADQRVVGYRRVLTGRSCVLCATASTQRYRTDELLPIHTHCDCTVAPIVGTFDPGRVINRELLAELKDAGGSRYWQARGISVDEDGAIVDAAGDPVRVTVDHTTEAAPTLAAA